jgi:hypothetical protein
MITPALRAAFASFLFVACMIVAPVAANAQDGRGAYVIAGWALTSREVGSASNLQLDAAGFDRSLVHSVLAGASRRTWTY